MFIIFIIFIIIIIIIYFLIIDIMLFIIPEVLKIYTELKLESLCEDYWDISKSQISFIVLLHSTL
jgi:hypothetical protein